MTASLPTSIRLSKPTLAKLDALAKTQKRSRSYIIEECVAQYEEKLNAPAPKRTIEERIARLKALQGSGVNLYAPRSQEDIDSTIRFIRGDDV